LSSEIIINKPVGLQKLLNINMNLLNIGFDEIFLMILFRDIYTYNIKYEKFAFGRDKFITFENMKSIHFIMNNVFVVKKLITLKLSPIYDDKFELKYNSDTSLNIEFTLADFIKELPTDKKMILSHLILNESNIITKINNIFSSIYKNTTIFNITDADRGNPTFYHNQEILIEKLLLSIFDLCIDNLHFKSNEYGIDIKLTDNLLSTHLNYNIIKHNDLNIADIYFNLYSGIYGQFYNSQILIKNPKYIEHSGGYESKYLKYKSKYLKLKNKLSNNIH
jgi:hypothetical protein